MCNFRRLLLTSMFCSMIVVSAFSQVTPRPQFIAPRNVTPEPPVASGLPIPIYGFQGRRQFWA